MEALVEIPIVHSVDIVAEKSATIKVNIFFIRFSSYIGLSLLSLFLSCQSHKNYFLAADI
jgi:hypothetical protein